MKKIDALIRFCRVTISISKLEGSGFHNANNHIVLNWFVLHGLTWPLKIIWGRPTMLGWLLAHEVGHAFLHRKNLYTDRTARLLFGNFMMPYRSSGVIYSIFHCKGKEYLTKYAAEHPLEDFAESFAFAVLRPKEIASLPDGPVKDKILYAKYLIEEALARRKRRPQHLPACFVGNDRLRRCRLLQPTLRRRR